MNGFARWSPRLLIAGAVFHIAVGLALSPLDEIANAGVVDSIAGYAER